jgi:3-methyladenine DNA glycosylase AlkD
MLFCMTAVASTAQAFIAELQKHANAKDADFLRGYFKDGAAADVFIGVRPPVTQKVCKEFKDLPLPQVQKLFDSKVHEHRQAAAILLVQRYKKADQAERAAIFELYLKNVRKGRVNNWDIVDMSAEYIIGPQVELTDRRLLDELAAAKDIWQRRVAIMSAFHYLKQGDAKTTLKLAEVLVDDPEDLIQKAVGWQLREVGKRCDRKLLVSFLDKHAATMPRTALRYSIEHFSPEEKKHYMGLASAKRGR